MNKKYNIDIIKKAFESDGYTLLSNSYINRDQKLRYKCPNGHFGTISWNNWYHNKSRCRFCANNVAYDIDHVRKVFEEEGYILLSDEYINAHTKLNYICPAGHKHSISFNKWNSGRRCGVCFSTKRKDINEVLDSFSSEGYILLSTEYSNAGSKLEYICPNGHKHATSFSNWRHGRRCPYCAGTRVPYFNDISRSFADKGYTVEGTSCHSAEQKMPCVCPNSHEFMISWKMWGSGYRCPMCSENIKISIDKVRESLLIEKCTLISEDYTNSTAKMEYICSRGHTCVTSWSNWNAGHRCMICRGIDSSGSNHPNWQGGVSFEPYCQVWKDKEYKNSIMERDKYECLNPCCKRNTSKLVIHHINYNKKDCKPSNLITVCNSCNTAANSNRDWHVSWYHAILRNRYNYNYN